MNEVVLFAQRSAVVAGALLLVLLLGLGLTALRQRSQDDGGSPPSSLFADQTVVLPRYRGRRRAPRKPVRVRHRVSVSKPRPRVQDRDTVRVQVVDPPQLTREGGRR